MLKSACASAGFRRRPLRKDARRWPASRCRLGNAPRAGRKRTPAACPASTQATERPTIDRLASCNRRQMSASLGPPGASVSVSRDERSCRISRSIHFNPHRIASPIAVAAQPSQICPPPKHRPMTVTYHSVAAVVTPTTRLSRRRIAPPPMKPTPVRMPSGSRMRSFMTNESDARPDSGSSASTCSIATDAARQTSIVVRRPAALPCSLRLSPRLMPRRSGSRAAAPHLARSASVSWRPSRCPRRAGTGRNSAAYCAALLAQRAAGLATLFPHFFTRGIVPYNVIW